MPFYEYECGSCGHYLEALQKISEPPLKKCPECGKSALKRLVSAPVFRLKGAGWYETDFKSDSEKKRNIAETGEAKEGDKPAEKPATTKSGIEIEKKEVTAVMEKKPPAKPSRAKTTPKVSGKAAKPKASAAAKKKAARR